ncbi:MAG: hypothetical protein DRI34_11250 [Deltaproteobacteria bacterium]|nr:MAG: hypothetical protein DRI34_11250 [Deltaproteobacteria bacterium]
MGVTCSAGRAVDFSGFAGLPSRKKSTSPVTAAAAPVPSRMLAVRLRDSTVLLRSAARSAKGSLSKSFLAEAAR